MSTRRSLNLLDEDRSDPPAVDFTAVAATPRKADPIIQKASYDAAKAAGFDKPTHAAPENPVRRTRRRETGRTEPFTVRIRPEARELVYELADQMRVPALADVVELAFERLYEDFKAGKVVR